MTSRHITAAEVKRDSVYEREDLNEKEKERNPNRQIERKLGIFLSFTCLSRYSERKAQ